MWSSTITPSTKGSMCFIILNASSKEYFEFLLESVNQWDTLCTYHYLNKATTTIISTSNIFINNNRGCYYRKWLIGKTRTEQALFSGSAKFGSWGYMQRVLLRSDSYTKKSYWGMSNAYYPMKLIDFCMKYNKTHKYI